MQMLFEMPIPNTDPSVPTDLTVFLLQIRIFMSLWAYVVTKMNSSFKHNPTGPGGTGMW